MPPVVVSLYRAPKDCAQSSITRKSNSQVCRLAKQMHRQDGPGFVGYRGADKVGIDIQALGFDINKNRNRTDVTDRLGSGNKSKCGGNDFVTVANAG